MTYASPKGTYDIVPDELDSSLKWAESHLWQFVESHFTKIAKAYCFQEIRTPYFERTELFLRSVGESSDVVSKEMYTFNDKGNRSMTLRPEMTASVLRAFVERNLQQLGSIHKLFYMGPMFRYDRPQAGRYRQFSQFGIESIGSSEPEADVEVISLLFTILETLGLKNLTLHINSVGDAASRELFSFRLKEFLKPKLHQLSSDSQVRFEKNPLRILDSKDLNDQAILQEAPKLEDCLSPESKEHFSKVLHYLKALNIDYHINSKLVRGLDYYNQTVFEITSGDLGSQNALGGGGRYDGLLKTLGGPDLPSIGFAFGIERVIQTMLSQGVNLSQKPVPLLYFVPMGDRAKQECFRLASELRKAYFSVEVDFACKNLKNRLKNAEQRNAKYIIVVGDNELETGKASIKNMSTREEKEINLIQLQEELSIIEGIK